MSPPAMTSDYDYPGNELDQAAKATNWKAYFRSRLAPYITGRVLEVGAGLGGTTTQLRTGAQTSWTCLEPDPNLAMRLRANLESTPSRVPTRVVVGDLRGIGDERFD